jgi:hypothetical protein
MNKTKIAVIIFLVSTILAVMPLAQALAKAEKPTVSIPNSNWTLVTDTPYPNNQGIHDIEGSGLLAYENGNSFVYILYEKAGSTQLADNQLTTDATNYFQTVQRYLLSDLDAYTDYTSSGINPSVASVRAGFAKGTVSTDYEEAIVEDFAFIKGNDYFVVFGVWDTDVDSDQVMSLIDSITVASYAPPTADPTATPTPTSPPLLEGNAAAIIVAVVVIGVVLVLVLVFVVKRNKTTQNAQFTYNPPAPPPPPPPA